MRTVLRYRRNGVRITHVYPSRWIAELLAAVMLAKGAVALLIGPATDEDEASASSCLH